MTLAIDITDPRLAKAYAHPLRIHILTLLDGRVASPREIADELGAPLSNTSYHIRKLAAFGLVELVSRTARRGAIEHHYTAKVRPTITDAGWARLPAIIKQAILAGGIEKAVTQMAVAAEQGGFDREDIHFSRTSGKLDHKAWTAVSEVLQKTLARLDRIIEESSSRAESDPESGAEDSTVIMLHFGGPSPKDMPDRSAKARNARGEDAAAPAIQATPRK
jgi:DNA-binding transcriptional ArsR family regulator